MERDSLGGGHLRRRPISGLGPGSGEWNQVRRVRFPGRLGSPSHFLTVGMSVSNRLAISPRESFFEKSSRT